MHKRKALKSSPNAAIQALIDAGVKIYEEVDDETKTENTVSNTISGAVRRKRSLDSDNSESPT
jgi:hypothetical protein